MLIELTDKEGQPVWINPAYVVRLEWTSATTSVVTLGVTQEMNTKSRPLSLPLSVSAPEAAARINAAMHPELASVVAEEADATESAEQPTPEDG